MASSESIHDTVLDEDAPGPPISVPDSGDTGEGGKLKMILQLVKKSLGVKDLAAMFVFSLIPIKRSPFTNYVIQAPFITSFTNGTCPKSRILALPRSTRLFCSVRQFFLEENGLVLVLSTNVLATC
jgi:oxysterol-binding protein-related protein 9/10/11